MKARLKRKLQIAKEIERKMQIAGEVFFEKRGDLGQAVALGRPLPRSALYLRRDPCNQQIAKVARKFAGKMLRVWPLRSSSSTTSSIRRGLFSLSASVTAPAIRAERSEQRPHGDGVELVAAAGDGLIESRK